MTPEVVELFELAEDFDPEAWSHPLRATMMKRRLISLTRAETSLIRRKVVDGIQWQLMIHGVLDT
jgi:hypothetical protein